MPQFRQPEAIKGWQRQKVGYDCAIPQSLLHREAARQPNRSRPPTGFYCSRGRRHAGFSDHHIHACRNRSARQMHTRCDPEPSQAMRSG